MRRINKNSKSEILNKDLQYTNQSRRTEIRDILISEQNNYCAYTDFFISEAVSIDIDHFNPELKDTNKDNYYNWFAVSTKYNRKKSDKWKEFQPILHPTADDLEKRIIYDELDGDYIINNSNDVEAKNLLLLLNINNLSLREDRKKFVLRMNDLKELLGEETFFDFIKKYPEEIIFKKAFEKTFMLLK